MPLAKTQSCLHFALQEYNETNDGEESSVQKTALHLPCGQPLYLPRRDSTPSDLNQYIKSHPKLVRRAQEIHQSSNEFCWKERAASSTCLNVLQGEVAHATSDQTKVLMSSEATTCHVLAVRSTSQISNGHERQKPLTSLAHIDECNPQCLENILKEHIEHHRQRWENSKLQPLSSSPAGDDDFGFYDCEDDNDAFGYPKTSGPSPTETSAFLVSCLPYPTKRYNLLCTWLADATMEREPPNPFPKICCRPGQRSRKSTLLKLKYSSLQL